LIYYFLRAPIKLSYNFIWCNFKRHLSSCITRKEENQDKEEIFRTLLEKMEELEKQNKSLSEEIKTLKFKKNNKTINNNGIINNANIINNNNTINIIQHGKEDLTKIENNVFLNALLKYTGLPAVANSINTICAEIPSKIIEGIHFNNKYPEFKNIYISDINREKIMLHNGKEWILSLSDNITSNLLDKSINYSENKYVRGLITFYYNKK